MRTRGVETAGKDGDRALRRIIVMLLALATLAERASGAPWPIRCLVLLILRPALGAGCKFVETEFPIPDLTDFPTDNSPFGALRLAACFKVLASVLQYMLQEPPLLARKTRRNDAGACAVAQCLNTLVSPPNSRAPPPRLPEVRQPGPHRQNGDVGRVRAPAFYINGGVSRRPCAGR